MPGLYFQPIPRRRFLETTFVAGVATVFQGALASVPASADEGEEVHVALLSDTHVGPGEKAKDPRGFDPCAQLRRVIPDIIAGSPRGVILNGDAASREGLAEDYRELKSLLEPLSRVAPVYIGLGNHDDRENFKQVFTSPVGGDAGVSGHQVFVVEQPVVRFLILDSLLYVNKVAGLLGERQRGWLTEYLGTHAEKPAILFVHHTLGEGDGDLLDAGRLFEIIRPHRQVKAIFYGHSHRWDISEREGVKLINLPSVGYNFQENQPVGWVDARFRRDRVDLTLHAIAGNRAQNGQTTRVAWK